MAQARPELLALYERLAREHPDLRVEPSDADARVAVAEVSVLAQRSADRVEDLVRKALTGRGFDPRVVKLACELVREQLSGELKEGHR